MHINSILFVRRIQVVTVVYVFLILQIGLTKAQEPVFGPKFQNLETMSTGEWWKVKPNKRRSMDLERAARSGRRVCRLHTRPWHAEADRTIVSARCPTKQKEVRLEFKQDRRRVGKKLPNSTVIELGWSAHFRIDNWDNSQDVAYRVRHGEEASFEGLIRKDPIDKDVIVVGNLSCNSSRTPGPRPQDDR